jgi:predicted nucleotidyltransferase
MLKEIETHRTQIAELCRRYGVKRLELFGSAARGEDFEPGRSDIDFLADFIDEKPPTLADLLDLETPGVRNPALLHFWWVRKCSKCLIFCRHRRLRG